MPVSRQRTPSAGEVSAEAKIRLESPFVLALSPLRRGLHDLAGRLVLALRPALTAQFEAGIGARSAVEKLALAALVERYRASDQLDRLVALHVDFWSGPAALNYHALTRGRFERVFRARHHGIIAPLQDAAAAIGACGLVEIGCGSGQLLDYLAAQLPQMERLVGLDLSADQVALNRRRASDSRIEYHCADATDWIGQHAQPGWIWLCYGGVLEFFTEQSVAAIFEHCGRHAPALFALVEPLADDFDPDTETSSRRFGRELTLSHPYPCLLADAGFAKVWRSECRAMGYRWLMLIAQCQESENRLRHT